MSGKWLIVAGIAAALATAGSTVAWRFAIFFAPYAWTGEPSRLRKVLGVGSGDRLAEIGAGDGALAVEIARVIGSSGVLYATELSADRRKAIAERSTRAGTSQVRVIEAAADATNLPDACCTAIYMRAVFHHIADKPAFARAVTRALAPGGRVAIIDFPPGALWFHDREHGVAAETVISAFQSAGLTLSARDEHWGGGMFMLRFERAHLVE